MGANVQLGRSPFNSLTRSKEALIIIDSVPILADAIYQMRLIDVKSIKINANGTAYYIRGSNGMVIIEKVYITEDNKRKANENYFLGEIDFGFEVSKNRYENSQAGLILSYLALITIL